MNWVPKCAICVANHALAEAHAATPPPVRNADTMFGGTALCRDHITAKPPAPGDTARAAGLVLPGG